jgi:uncharacterized membrane protein YqjE
MSASEPAQNIATAITEISERSLQLVHEEIELAKAEVSQKVTRLIGGAIVGFAAGIFVATALFFVLVGLALLAWLKIPLIGQEEYFWGFFIVAGVLLILAALAGGLAARAVRASSPPVPSMALEEARKIRETVNAGTAPGIAAESLPGWDPVEGGTTATPAGPIAGAQSKEP